MLVCEVVAGFTGVLKSSVSMTGSALTALVATPWFSFTADGLCCLITLEPLVVLAVDWSIALDDLVALAGRGN